MATRLTLEALEVLDAIDRKGSFAAAAAALYRVPSAITYTVQKLEQDLGVQLFRKQGRRSVLTPAGKVLLEQGRDLLLAAERLVETTRQVDSGWESCLNIALDSVLDPAVLSPHLAAFYAEQPEVEINIYDEVLGGSWEAILEERVELVVGAPEVPAQARGLRYTKLMDAEWVFAVAADHPLAAIEGPLDEDALGEYRAVVVRDSSRHLPPLTRRVFDQQATLRVASMGQKILAQRQGLGVGFLPRHRVADELARGELVAVPLSGAIHTSPLHLAWPAASKGKALHWWVDRLRDAFN